MARVGSSMPIRQCGGGSAARAALLSVQARTTTHSTYFTAADPGVARSAPGS